MANPIARPRTYDRQYPAPDFERLERRMAARQAAWEFAQCLGELVATLALIACFALLAVGYGPDVASFVWGR